MTDTLTREVDGLRVPVAGIYTIDPTHTRIEAIARHLMVTRVRGHFAEYEGTITVAEDPTRSSVEIILQAASITTGVEDRDAHLRSPDFLDVENHATVTFRSTSIVPNGNTWTLTGDLTIVGKTNPVSLDLEFLGVIADPWGNPKSAFSASGEFNRHDFGLSWNVPLDGGGVLVSEVFKLEIEAQFAPQGMSTVHIAGLSGSLRRGSYNTALLRAAQSVLPANTKLEILEYADVPLFNRDVEVEGMPAPVHTLRAHLGRADAILFAAPEYNASIPGVMKNAIDWASRGPDSPLDRKPAALMGAGGRLGTAYAQQHLRQILLHNDMRVINRPNVLISRAPEHFDEELTLTNERYLKQIERLLVALVAEVER